MGFSWKVSSGVPRDAPFVLCVCLPGIVAVVDVESHLFAVKVVGIVMPFSMDICCIFYWQLSEWRL